MTGVGLAKLIDFAFTLAEVGLQRGAFVAKAKEMEEAGATPKEVYLAMREQMKSELQKLLDVSNA